MQPKPTITKKPGSASALPTVSLPSSPSLTNHRVSAAWRSRDGGEYTVNYLFSGYETPDSQFKIVNYSGNIVSKKAVGNKTLPFEPGERTRVGSEFLASMPPSPANLKDLPYVSLAKLKAGKIMVAQRPGGKFEIVEPEVENPAPAAKPDPAAKAVSAPPISLDLEGLEPTAVITPTHSAPPDAASPVDDSEAISPTDYIRDRVTKGKVTAEGLKQYLDDGVIDMQTYDELLQQLNPVKNNGASFAANIPAPAPSKTAVETQPTGSAVENEAARKADNTDLILEF